MGNNKLLSLGYFILFLGLFSCSVSDETVKSSSSKNSNPSPKTISNYILLETPKTLPFKTSKKRLLIKGKIDLRDLKDLSLYLGDQEIEIKEKGLFQHTLSLEEGSHQINLTLKNVI